MDFLPGLKTALGGFFLLMSLIAPEVISEDDVAQLVELVSQFIGAFLVVYGLGMKLYRLVSGLYKKYQEKK